jgi:2-haloacid dehalogenase
MNLAKYNNYSWDVILGAEVVRTYKPDPDAYKRAAACLGLEPSSCMMVAAHNYDLKAAQDGRFQDRLCQETFRAWAESGD